VRNSSPDSRKPFAWHGRKLEHYFDYLIEVALKNAK